jgi:pteridine reductase
MDPVDTKPHNDLPVALVTGGAVRVGRSICERLAGDSFRMAIHYNGSRQAADDLVGKLADVGSKADSFCIDLTRPGATNKLVEKVIETTGRIDLLVNNAAVFVSDDGKMTDLAMMKVLNMDVPAKLVEIVTPYLIETGGSVVNIADLAGFVEFPRFKAYSLTKKNLLSLTFRKALELAAHGVRVNAVCPGTVLFPKWYSPEKRQEVIDGIPMGREGTPQDIAGAVAYLSTAQFVTGQTLSVDGGRLAALMKQHTDHQL